MPGATVEDLRRVSARELANIGGAVDWRPCNFGGVRPYAFCRFCPRTVLHLYRYQSHLACRSCLGLSYASQRERSADRARRAARKIRARLGASENLFLPIAGKPKHMKQTTFDKLRARAARYEGQSLVSMAQFIERLKGSR